MEGTTIGKQVTVQGVGTPVSAFVRGVSAGLGTLSSNDRSAKNKDNGGKQQLLLLEKEESDILEEKLGKNLSSRMRETYTRPSGMP